MDFSGAGVSELTPLLQADGMADAAAGFAREVRLPGGAALQLPVTNRPDIRSTLLLSLPKAGSTLLGQLATDIASYGGPPVVQLHDMLFAHGVTEFGAGTADLGLEALFEPHGYIYGPFRQFPTGVRITDLHRYTAILLVRDPRDVLVSDYFSMAFSHPAPGGESTLPFLEWQESLRRRTIDDVILERMHEYRGRYLDYMRFMETNTASVFRYEDIIYAKETWVAELAALLGVDIEPSVCRSIAQSRDVIPGSENRYEHVRQVHPGNFRKKLQRATIKEIERTFADIMDAFHYDRVGIGSEARRLFHSARQQLGMAH